MKRTTILLSTLLLILLALSSASPTSAVLAQTPQSATSSGLENAAKEFVILLSQGQFTQAAQTFDPTLVKPETNTQVEQAWDALIKQMGAFQKISETVQTREQNLDMVYVATDFAKGSVDIRIVFNKAGQVAGMQYFPAGTGKAAAQPYKTAPYVKPGSFTEQEIVVGAPGFSLPGILTIPTGQGPFPAVVLVHGSGPNDRDETIFANKPFRDLAEGLSSQGIAVLRYDKRSKVYAQQMNENPAGITVKEEVTDDALSAIELLHKTPGIDPQRIYVLGHSLGGMLAPRIAEQAQATPAAGLAGAIIMAGPTRPLEDLMVEQVTYLYQLAGTITPEQQTQLDQLKQQAAKVKDPNLSLDTPREQLLLGASAAYWLDLQDYKPAQTAANLSIPLFILRGERDYQVAQADFDGWKAALGDKPGVIYKQYPSLNHLFISGTGPANPQEYQLPSHVSEQVVNDIASFIKTGQVSQNLPLLGRFSLQEIIRLVMLLIPLFLIQAGLSIYALVDLARRKKTHGPRWLWAVLLVLTLFALPTGLIVAGVYLFWGRNEEDGEDGDDDSD